MKKEDQLIECPCYHICKSLGLEVKRWCRYYESELPPPGMFRFNPKEEWCPTGVQANVLMLGHLLTQGAIEPERAEAILEQVRQWAQELRKRPSGYKPVR
jgi:hypothetical protein